MAMVRSAVFRYFAATVVTLWLVLITGFVVLRPAPLAEVDSVAPAPDADVAAKYNALVDLLRERLEAPQPPLRTDTVPEAQPPQPAVPDPGHDAGQVVEEAVGAVEGEDAIGGSDPPAAGAAGAVAEEKGEEEKDEMQDEVHDKLHGHAEVEEEEVEQEDAQSPSPVQAVASPQPPRKAKPPASPLPSPAPTTPPVDASKRHVLAASGVGEEAGGDTADLAAALDRLLHIPRFYPREYAVNGLSMEEGLKMYKEALAVGRSQWAALRSELASSPFGGMEASCAGELHPVTGAEEEAFSVLLVGSGSGYVAQQLGQTYLRSAVVCMERNATLVDFHRQDLLRTATTNNIILQEALTPSTVAAWSHSAAFFRYVIVTDLVPLLDALLPHELEATMGQLMGLGQTTFFFPPNPSIHADAAKHSRYFDYWTGTEDFLYKSALRAGLEDTDVARRKSILFAAHVGSSRRSFSACMREDPAGCEQEQAFDLVFSAPVDEDDTKVSLSHNAARQVGAVRCSGVPVSLLLAGELVQEHRANLFAGLALLPATNETVAAAVVGDWARWSSAGVDVDSVPKARRVLQSPLPMPSNKRMEEKSAWTKPAAGERAPRREQRSLPSPLPSPAPKSKPSVRPQDLYAGYAYQAYAYGAQAAAYAAPYDDDDASGALYPVQEWAYGSSEEPLMYFDDDEGNYFGSRVYDDDEQGARKPFGAALKGWKMPEKGKEEKGGAFQSRGLLAFDFDKFEKAEREKQMPEARPAKQDLYLPLPPQHWDAMLARSIASFDGLWSYLEEDLEQRQPSLGSWLLADSGIGLLASKVAKRYPKATVVSVDESVENVDYQIDMLAMLALDNIIVARGSVADPAVVSSVLSHSTVFSTQVVEAQLLLKLLFASSSMEGFCGAYGNLLSLASTSYVVVPNPNMLQAAASLLGRGRQLADFELATYECALRGQVEELDVVTVAEDEAGWAVLRVDVRAMSRIVQEKEAGVPEVRLRYGRDWNGVARVTAQAGTRQAAQCTAVSTRMVDVATLIALGVDYEFQTELVLMYLEVEVQADMRPSYLFWRGKKRPLWYFNAATGKAAQDILLTAEKRHFTDLSSALLSEIRTSAFTLLHLNSGSGELSRRLAYLRPGSTIVSLEGDEALSGEHNRAMEEAMLYNNLVGNTEVDIFKLDLLLRSPEFFQFGLVSNVLTGVRQQNLDWLQQFLSKALQMSKTTFVELPSPALLSLAYYTIFPASMPEGRAPSYHLADHPMPLFVDSSRRLLSALIDLPGLDGVRLSLVDYEADAGRQLLRIDLVDMERDVRHHFLLPKHEHKEKHTRKYRLHHHLSGSGPATRPKEEEGGEKCEGSGVETVEAETYLVRNDGSAIVYDEFGITMIAALRLGIFEQAQERLYHQFIRMDLREDMAPWNIQFRAGSLRYVDKDSEEVDFEGFLPHVHQVVAAMINFREAVRELGHCGSPVPLPMDVPIVNSCVDSWDHPSCDILIDPIPCADGTCHTTFISCLRSLAALEEELQMELLYDDPADDAQRAVWAHGMVTTDAPRFTTITLG